MGRWWAGTAALAAALGAGAVLSGGPFGVVGALLLGLIGPGLAFGAAIAPKGEVRGVARVVIALGLAIIAVIIGGIVLDRLPWGVNRTSWIVYLGGLTFAVSAFAWFRAGPSRELKAPRFARVPLGLGLAATALTAGALIVAIAGAANAPQTPFTQLWIVGGDSPHQARIGIGNSQATVEEYNLRLVVDGRNAASWTAIRLEPDQDWTQTIALPSGWRSAELQLYRRSAPDAVFRTAVLWNPHA